MFRCLVSTVMFVSPLDGEKEKVRLMFLMKRSTLENGLKELFGLVTSGFLSIED